MQGLVLTAVLVCSLTPLGSANGKGRLTGRDICKDANCGYGEVCVPQQVVCKKEPCIPVPRCFKRGKHPCSRCRCPHWKFCIIDITGKGNACIPPIVIPRPMKPPVDPCALVLCPKNTRCVNGICKTLGVCPRPLGRCANFCKRDSDCAVGKLCCNAGCGFICVTPVQSPSLRCSNVNCEKGKVCVLKEVKCVEPPCEPDTLCVPLKENDCANVRCSFGTVCILTKAGGPACVSDDPLCTLVSCPNGQICEDGKCVPYEPINRCIDVTCACGLICNPNTGQCVPKLLSSLCNDRRCDEGEVCVLLEVVCVTSPCFPDVQCVPKEEDVCRDLVCKNGVCVISQAGSPVCLPDNPIIGSDPCTNVLCHRGLRCIGGKCVPLDPSSLCLTVDCPEGQVCVLREVQCKNTPCPALPDCVYPENNGCAKKRCSHRQVCVLTSTGVECRSDKPNNPCSLPLDPGPRGSSFNRFYFNELTGQCQLFTYGGYLGNANNFVTREDCRRICGAPNPCTIKVNGISCPKGLQCYVEGESNCDSSKQPCPLLPLKVACVNSCTMPVVRGPCYAIINRFYYNSDTKSCEPFIYGGCQGNLNNFKTKDGCESRCVDPCTLPAVQGPCLAIFHRFFYNPTNMACELFIYGGCLGNANNFKTREDCEKQCVNPCVLPAVKGPCLTIIRRHFYNTETEACEPFVYGGCLGNGNNFRTKEECEERCVDPCTLPAVKGPCRARIPRFFHSTATKACEPFFYGGCKGNANNFATKDACEDKCVDLCTLPAVSGPCYAFFIRYFYNTKTKACESFTYGGCKGNANNFKTKEECERRCADPCTLPKVQGPCKAFFKRFFYNTETKACELFIYGGCQGNANNFRTERQCEDQCTEDLCAKVTCSKGEACVIKGDKPGELPPRRALCVDICFLEADSGPCYALITRWHYDADENLCRTFNWGGCEGNENNFANFQQCQNQCEKKHLCKKCSKGKTCVIKGDCDPTQKPCSDPARSAKCVNICQLDQDSGPCDEDISRFFYDSQDYRCKPFTYGGCGGNQNNFKSIKGCKAQCNGLCEGFYCPADKICIVRKIQCSKGRITPTPTCVPKEKEGGCSTAFSVNLIICPDVPRIECENDYDCPGDQKCCPRACREFRCFDPIDTTEKEGMCPDPADHEGNCGCNGPVLPIGSCTFDSECTGRDKCCMHICGRLLCVRPVKKGSCPAPKQVNRCDISCKLDLDCPRELKCCNNEEGDAYCVEPETVTRPEDECPYSNPCELRDDSCLSDDNCPQGQKCCPFGTGKRCIKLSRYA